MKRQNTEKPYIYEYCFPQTIHDILPNKIRRMGHSCAIPTRKEVISLLLPNTIAGYMENTLYPITHDRGKSNLITQKEDINLGDLEVNKKDGHISTRLKSNKNYKKIDGLLLFPIYPWGQEFDLMHLHLKNDKYLSTYDYPEKLSKQTMNYFNKIISYKTKTSQLPIYLGISMTLTRLSIPYPHEHISQLSQYISVEQIQKFRSSPTWDNGISNIIASELYKTVKSIVKSYNNSANIEIDNVGISITLKDFSSEDLISSKFYSKLYKPICSSVKTKMEEIHNIYYCNSTLDEFLEYYKSQIDLAEPVSAEKINFFLSGVKKPLCKYCDKLESLKLQSKLREPAAWSISIRFENKRNTRIYINFNFTNDEIGPFESLGIKLAEKQEPGFKKIPDTTLEELSEVLFSNYS